MNSRVAACLNTPHTRSMYVLMLESDMGSGVN